MKTEKEIPDDKDNEQFILYIKHVFSYIETILKEEAGQKTKEEEIYFDKGQNLWKQ